MAGNFTNKPTLFVKVHPGEVRLIAREDLAGLWDNPDLHRHVNRLVLLLQAFPCDIDTSELSS